MSLSVSLLTVDQVIQLQRSEYNLMNTTKALFSELVYDFQSERWNEFELPKLSLRELQALAKLLGCPAYGTKEMLVIRLLAQRELRFKLARFTAPIGVNRCATCAERPVFGDQATNSLFLQAS